ncbi:hypothetical protein H0H87_004874 [Tephrocybe sp. NHM501043]|nr:hypothetical protein H0H87_004874 [Tephrocybe sp. NHM501043]
MSLYLCVDCGGSKTSAVICDVDGTILGRALGGPSNFAYLSLEQFIKAVTDAVSSALTVCSAPSALPPTGPTPFAAASFGVSGVDSPSAVATITPALSNLLGIPAGPRLVVANDTHLLATPIFMHPDIAHAVAVIGGTGSIAVSFRLSQDPATAGLIEELARIGGWGWILGDEGGGFSVGREAVRQILLDFDRASVVGRPPTPSVLTTSILQRFGVSHVPELLPLVHLPDSLTSESPEYLKHPREKRLSNLSPLVFDAAFEHNDALALRILRSCAGFLADYVSVLLGEGADDIPSQRVVKAQESVISFGGSLVGIERYRALVLEDLERRGQVFKYVEFVDDAAAIGAKGLAASARLAQTT